jgi:Flp pilus assembly protein TadD
LGFALIQAGQKTKARPYLEQASQLMPQNSEMALSVRCALDLY